MAVRTGEVWDNLKTTPVKKCDFFLFFYWGGAFATFILFILLFLFFKGMLISQLERSEKLL